MIKQALTELGGCSPWPAIAGYILGRFSGFPACHDALLSAHLRRLLAEGVLRTHGQDYVFATPEQSRKDPTTAVPVKRRGPGRPRKSPQASSDTPLLPAKRKHATEDDDDDPVTKRGPWRPTTQEIRAEAAGGEEATTFQNGGVQSGGASGAKRGRGRPRKQNPSAAPAAAAMSPSSTRRGRGRPRKHKPPEAAASSPTTGAAASRGFKRGCGRPSKEKPPEATANSPTTGAAASRGFKRGCGSPSMDRASAPAVSAEASMEKLAATAAAMYAETGDAAASTGAEAGGGHSRMENLAAAVAAMSGQGTKRGRGRPRKEKPPAPAAGAGVKRSRGRPGKDRSIRPRLVEYSCTLEEEEDSVSGEKTTQAEMGVATGAGKETRVAADAAGRVPVSAPAPAGATDPDLDPANLADDAASTGIKRPRGRPRKNKPSGAAADDCVSTGVKRGRGRPRTEKLEEAMPAETGNAAPPTGVKRGRGRPRKERLEEGMSAETGVAARPTVVKRGRGRPRTEKLEEAMLAETGVAAPTVVKRGRGRPKKKKQAAVVKRGGGRPRKDQSSRTGLAEAAGEALFRDMAEAPGNFGEDRD